MIPPAPAPHDERPADRQPQADALADPAAEWIERAGPDGCAFVERADAGPSWDEAIAPPRPCEQCGGIVRWIDAAGGLNCPTRSTPRTADRLQQLASEARVRYPLEAAGGGDPPTPSRLPPWPPRWSLTLSSQTRFPIAGFAAGPE